ncbi:hypothetical protein Efla_000586 [Eimeria flavescens]
MARNRDGNIPFLLAEDLHLWLISYTLLMVLTSSFSFVSDQVQFPPYRPVIEFVILMNWVFVFGASVFLYSLALLLGSMKAARLLFPSMCIILLPRACLPFRFGECMMQHICFIAFNFFTAHPTRKILSLCVLTVLISLVSDFFWGALPTFLASLRAVAGFAAITGGHLAYQTVRAFSQQLRESKRPVLTLVACSAAAADCESKRMADGFVAARSRRAAHGGFQRMQLRRGHSHNLTCGQDLQMTGARLLWRTKTAAAAYAVEGETGGACSSSARVHTRRYWTSLDDYAPLYHQAVHRRLKIFKDDMLRFATEIEDTGVWRSEEESQLFVVPRRRYGYVDQKWYLDLEMPEALEWRCSSPTGEASAERKPSMAAAAAEAADGPLSLQRACLRVDTLELPARASCFHRSFSVGQELDKSDPPWATEKKPVTFENSGSAGGPQRGLDAGSAQTGRNQQACSPNAVDQEEVNLVGPNVEEAERSTKGFQQGDALPHPSHKTLDARRLRASAHRRRFVRTRQCTRRTSFPVGSGLLRTATGSGGTRGFKHVESDWACGCMPHLLSHGFQRKAEKGESYSENISREEILLPKMAFGTFTDYAIERWYILWRADHIAGFYKETASFTMLIGVLQCVFGMIRAVVIEYLTGPQGFYVADSTCHLKFSEGGLKACSIRPLIRRFSRHLAQLGVLMALTLPMRFIDSRGGKNVWKFQLLALGQAIIQVLFIFVDVYMSCFGSLHEDDDRVSVVTRAAVQFITGGCQIFPLLIIALSVHLRRIPQIAICFGTFGAACSNIFILCSMGLELKVLLFFTLSRALYGVFALMIARSFESIRRQLFSSHALPFLLYLSTLANGRQVDNIVAMRAARGCAPLH